MRTLLLLEEQKPTNGTKEVSRETVDSSPKNYLNEFEMKKFLVALRAGRYGVRDFCIGLLMYRHGLRVGELCRLRLDCVDLEAGQIFIKRQKGSLSTTHPISGIELRAIRAWLKLRQKFACKDSQFLMISERGNFGRQAISFLFRKAGERMNPPMRVNCHALRHGCGFYLANKGVPTRVIQDWLGHRCIVHTERYTRTSAASFKGLWSDD